MNAVCDSRYIYILVCIYAYTYAVNKWPTSFENGAQKFRLCAIGPQSLNLNIIPETVFDRSHVNDNLFHLVKWMFLTNI